MARIRTMEKSIFIVCFVSAPTIQHFSGVKIFYIYIYGHTFSFTYCISELSVWKQNITRKSEKWNIICHNHSAENATIWMPIYTDIARLPPLQPIHITLYSTPSKLFCSADGSSLFFCYPFHSIYFSIFFGMSQVYKHKVSVDSMYNQMLWVELKFTFFFTCCFYRIVEIRAGIADCKGGCIWLFVWVWRFNTFA